MRYRLAATLCALVFILPACDAVTDRLGGAFIERMAERGSLDPFADGRMHVLLCGTGTPLPNRDRANACTAIVAGGEVVVVDTGTSSLENVMAAGIPIGALSAILFTHYHSDHIGEFGDYMMMSWGQGRAQPLDVIGPSGLHRVVRGFESAYALDTAYRTAHHGADLMPPDANTAAARVIGMHPLKNDVGIAMKVFERNGLTIDAFRVNHDPVDEAFGYRFEYGDDVVVVSGDTKKCANVAKHARGADVLIHEAMDTETLLRAVAVAEQQPNAEDLARFLQFGRDIPVYHTSPVEAAELAQDADVPVLVLTHLGALADNWVGRRYFLRGVDDVYDGEVILGEDGMWVEF